MTDAVLLARIAALEARAAAAELRLAELERAQQVTREVLGAEQGERLEIADRLADVEARVFPPAPAP